MFWPPMGNTKPLNTGISIFKLVMFLHLPHIRGNISWSLIFTLFFCFWCATPEQNILARICVMLHYVHRLPLPVRRVEGQVVLELRFLLLPLPLKMGLIRVVRAVQNIEVTGCRKTNLVVP